MRALGSEYLRSCFFFFSAANIESNLNVCKYSNSFLVQETKEDDPILIHFVAPINASINLINLKKELKWAKIASHSPNLSFKKIALSFFLATISIGPSCWDTGTDINQGQLYLNGDFYTKHVSIQNDTSVIDYNCTWIETTRKVLDDIESDRVIYTYKCFEKDEYWGYITLAFVFVTPGLCQAAFSFLASKSLQTQRHKIIGYCISLGFLLLCPFFPIQVFLVKLFAFLTNGEEMKKIGNLMTLCEAIWESNLQLTLQLYIIFIRADRELSTAQILGLSSSIIFLAKSMIEENFADKPNEPLLKKLTQLPQKLSQLIFLCVSYAIILSIFHIIFFLIGFLAILAFGLCLGWIYRKAKISQGQKWYDQQYKGVPLMVWTLEAVLFIILPILLVLVNTFPDSTIYSVDAVAIISLNSSDLIVQTKLSEIALVKENWANYVIPITLISGVVFTILFYKQNIKAEETIQIINKDNQQDIYEIPRGTLKNSPLKTEVVKVSVDGKTFIVPKDDLDIEKYPQEPETKTMVKCSNKKEDCFKNLKKKVSCGVEDETPKPIKAYIVKIEDMKELIIDPENSIDG